jgi:predicted PurR-regulated permease PerM
MEKRPGCILIHHLLFAFVRCSNLCCSLATKPKISSVLSDPTAVINNIKQAVMQIQAKAGVSIVTEKSLSNTLDQTITIIPSLLNSTLNLVSNLITMLFFLYYMLYHGREIEMTLFRIIPLKDANTTMLASETKKLVKANAIGIPLISIIQGLTATLGYFILELMNLLYGDFLPVCLLFSLSWEQW